MKNTTHAAMTSSMAELVLKTISNFHGLAFGETFRGVHCSSITCQ